MIDYQEELEQYKERIDELATQKRYAELRDLFLPMEPADIALLLEEGMYGIIYMLFQSFNANIVGIKSRSKN